MSTFASTGASTALLIAAPVFPIVLMEAWLLRALRQCRPILLIIAPLPALATALMAAGAPPATFWYGPVAIVLALDLQGAILLGVSSLLWMAAAAYAIVDRRGRPIGARFAMCWLLTLSGSIGVFLTADLASFFLAYALVSIPAYGLVVDNETPPAWRAGAVYLAYAILGETVLLMGFWLLAGATPHGSLSIHDALAALPGSPWRGTIVALLIAGFGMKIGLVPVHVWMPLTYRASPIPAAAVLSGAAVKAGVIGLIRFLPLGTVLPDTGAALAAIGLLGAFYGVAVGITQASPKAVLAYSSVSQMGLIAAILGMGLAAGDAGAGMATAFYAAHHVLVKGALFLAIGAAAATTTRRPLLVLAPALVLALGFGGLPLSGGAVAKLAAKAALGKGLVADLSNLSAACSTLLMLHFMWRLAAEPVSEAPPRGVVGPWLVLAVAAVAVPWFLYPLASGGTRAEALAPAALWSSLWPVLLGVLLAAALHRLRNRVPRIPEGDILAASGGIAHQAVRWSEVIERWEGASRQWPVASLSVLAVATLLAATMLIAR